MPLRERGSKQRDSVGKSMTNVLHAAATLRASPGILQQMQWEQDAANTLGLEWRSRYFSSDVPDDELGVGVRAPKATRSSSRLINWLVLRISFLLWLAKQGREVDLVLLRYSTHDPFQVLFLVFCGRKTFLVHHTKEVEELRAAGDVKGRLRASLEKISGALSIQLAAGTVAVTPEILQYEQSRVRRPPRFFATYPNGIKVTDFPVADHRGDIPFLLFVASTFAPWHGLDLLLESARSNSDSFEVHLVGEIPKLLRPAIDEDSRFVVHGMLNRDEIISLGEQAWLGVSSLAADRKGLSQACTLKVREYLSWGIPSVGAYCEVLPEGFPFYVKTSPHLVAVLEEAHRMRSMQRETVRRTAEPHISKEHQLQVLVKEIEAYISVQVGGDKT